MSKIAQIKSFKVLNSRADWTIRTEVVLKDGSVGVSVVPEGASKGENEAACVSAEEAIRNIKEIVSEELVGKDVLKQEVIDNTLLQIDGTSDKSKLGGNTILSTSLAAAKAAALSQNLPLYKYIANIYGNKNPLKTPTPVFNILNGGKHAKNNLSFQEFMVIPSPHFSFEKQLEVGAEAYKNLKLELTGRNMSTSVGDEGGFAPEGLNPKSALDLIKRASSKSYKSGDEVFYGLDVAAESFWNGHSYSILEENLELDRAGLVDYYKSLLGGYELIYLEDPFYEKDLAGWELFSEKIGKKVMVVGDDLVVTNSKFLKEAISDSLINAVIVKPNQVGTLTETFEFIRMAQKAGLSICVSHRSGDTAEDTFISDLAVGVGAEFMKSGAPARGERVAKYNRLLEIYHSIT